MPVDNESSAQTGRLRQERGKGGFGRCVAVGLLLMAALGFVTLFSYTTSPLYAGVGNVPDSPIFQLIGKYWAQGAVPYVDLWDMKGPAIFLVNAAGYGLTGSRTGVYLIQVICLFLTLLALYRLLRLRYSPMRAVGLSMIPLAFLSYVYEGGNLTEEYLLPLLTYSFYLVARWTDKLEATGETDHYHWHAAIYGLVVGLSLMSRLTNGLAMSGAVAVIAWMLLRQRRYGCLWKNAGGFLLGFLAMTVPFFVYFYRHDALAAMWNATFVYAFEYASNPVRAASAGLHYYLLSYLGSWLMLLTVGLMVWRQKKLTVRAALWLLAALLPGIWFCQGNGFGHYGMTVFPLLALAFMELDRLPARWLRYAAVLLILVGCASKVRFVATMHRSTEPRLAEYHAFLAASPAVDKTSFVAYNCLPQFYLDSDIRPAAPFFALQDLSEERISQVSALILDCFRQRKVRWILLSTGDEPPAIQPLLDECYERVSYDKEKQLALYRLKS